MLIVLKRFYCANGYTMVWRTTGHFLVQVYYKFISSRGNIKHPCRWTTCWMVSPPFFTIMPNICLYWFWSSTFVWGRLYALDVHCNSFFPTFVMLYGIVHLHLAFQKCPCLLSVNVTDRLFSPVVQYFLSPILVAHSFIAALLSNLLFMVTLSYYHYLNFLGYDGEEDSKFLHGLSELL